ncbi:cytochrome c-like [Octopus vulgaris]|uniref:Cytochrome c-like n=2 Tax=Octopus vulgaris TaxID=6645 RepID=A0AA36B5T6_OCTVU|nr:cytochrome c-like [Octopus vulgaris]
MKLIVLAVLLCMVINFDTCLGTADGNTIFKRAIRSRNLRINLRAGERIYKRLGPYLLIICSEKDEDVGLMNIIDEAHMGRILNQDEIRKFLYNPKQYYPGTRLVFAGIKKKSELEGLIAYIIQSCKQY